MITTLTANIKGSLSLISNIEKKIHGVKLKLALACEHQDKAPLAGPSKENSSCRMGQSQGTLTFKVMESTYLLENWVQSNVTICHFVFRVL